MKKIISLPLLFTAVFSVSNITRKYNDNNGKENKNAIISHYSLDSVKDSGLFDSLIDKEASSLFEEKYYSQYYFKNLRNNFGNNKYGTCSYVSAGMLLSFYDSYWDDSIIDEKYEVKGEFEKNYQPDADFELIPTNASSPGIMFEPNYIVNNLNVQEYLELVNQRNQNYFQMYLISLGKSIFGDEKFDGTDDSLGMSQDEMIQLLSTYLYNVAGKNAEQISVESISNKSQNQFHNAVCQQIRNGVPVLLRIKKADDSFGHTVIAYDYDSKNGEIYVHTGWRNEDIDISLTHVSLSDLPFNEIIGGIYLKIKTSYTHSHAFNYHSSSNDNYCACSFVYPREIEQVSDAYCDSVPSYKWKSLYSEKWFPYEYSYQFEFSLLNSQKYEVCSYSYINGTSFSSITQEDWDKLHLNYSGSTYYVYVNLMNCRTLPYADEYWCRKQYSKVSEYKSTPYIFPNEYGYSDAYPSDWSTSNTFRTHQAHNGSSFQTKRFRTGYIHNEYVVLSPIRSGYDEAYIEYKFEYPVSRIDVYLSFWRSQSLELLNRSSCMAQAQILINGQWTCVLDLLSSSTNLPNNRSNQKKYKITFPRGITSFRFIAKTFKTPTNNDNKGRICIGKLAYYEARGALPLSGYELAYSPSSWENTTSFNNCYAYALNNQVYPGTNEKWYKQQPGGYSGIKLNGDYSKETIKNAVTNDFSKYNNDFGTNLVFLEVDKYAICPAGTYKVALVSYEGDYHWYRQDADGYWSHKPGTTPVTRYDKSDKLIVDPETCNRGNYVNFLGFYAVSPWNNLYFC